MIVPHVPYHKNEAFAISATHFVNHVLMNSSKSNEFVKLLVVQSWKTFQHQYIQSIPQNNCMGYAPYWILQVAIFFIDQVYIVWNIRNTHVHGTSAISKLHHKTLHRKIAIVVSVICQFWQEDAEVVPKEDAISNAVNLNCHSIHSLVPWYNTDATAVLKAFQHHKA